MSVLDTEFLRFEPEEARTLERFCELCDRAAPYGLHVCLEFAIYTGVRTLAHAAGVVARSKRSNASVLVDALRFSRSGGLPAHITQVDPSLFRYAQICDAGPDTPDPGDTPALIREARTGRLLPGEGVLPLAELVAALPGMGAKARKRRRYAIRAVIFQEGEWLCAQCLEYDLVAQAKSLPQLVRALERLIVGHIAVRLRHKQEPFRDLPRAPRKYWTLFRRSRLALPAPTFRVAAPRSHGVIVAAPEVRIAALDAA